MSDDNYYVASRKILGIHTNVDDFTWSYGMSMPKVTRKEYSDCRIRIRLEVLDHLVSSGSDSVGWQELTGKYHYFSGIHDQDIIRYKRNFLFGSELQIEAKGLLTEEPHLLINKNYYKYIRFRFMNLHSIGYILTDLAGLLLLHRGYAPLHCSAFRKRDATVVVLAPPNTGKTLSTMMACMEYGADFIAEDIAITDGHMIYSVPWTSTFRYYSKVDKRHGSKVVNMFTRILPLLELISFIKPKPFDTYIERQRLLDSAHISHLVILERGDESILHEAPAEIFRKVLNLNKYEFNYQKAPIAVAHEYFNPGLNIYEAGLSEREILRTMIDSAKETFIVRAKDPTQYATLILNNINSIRS